MPLFITAPSMRLAFILACSFFFFFFAQQTFASSKPARFAPGTSRSRETGTSSSSSSPSTANRVHLHDVAQHAIILSDLKLDDTAAIDYLARLSYRKLHVVGTGISKHAAAHGHLLHFIAEQRLPLEKIQYYSGGANVLQQDPETTHEQNFLGTPTPPQYSAADLFEQIPAESTVDIFHIAPTSTLIIRHLTTSRNFEIKTYHHIVGYNSNLDKQSHRGSASKDTQEFLQTIAQRIKDIHPDADVFFTSNPTSFVGNQGSTVEYSIVKDRYPRTHLEAAKNDPFHRSKLKSAEAIVVSHRSRGVEVPPLYPQFPVAGTKQSDDPDTHLQHLINVARFSEHPNDRTTPLRDHFTNYLEKAIPIVDAHGNDSKLTQRLQRGVREAFVEPGRLEMCDAIHVASVNGIRLSKDRTHIRPARLYPEKGKGDKIVMMLGTAATGQAYQGHTLVGLTGSEALQFLFGSRDRSR